MKKILTLMLGFILALTTVMGVVEVSSADFIIDSEECSLAGISTTIDDWGWAYNDGNYGGVDESEFCLVWAIGCEDDEWASVDLYFPGSYQTIEIRHLDGISNLDSFEVWVDSTLVGTYQDSLDSQENWIDSFFDVSVSPGVHTVRLEVVDQEWGSCDTWGQLAVDYIEVYEDDTPIPEFGVIGAAAVLGLAGLFIYRRRK